MQAGRPCSRCGIVRGRSEPVKAVCGRRATAPVELLSERTREDGLDRTCPNQELAAIGSRDTRGHGLLTLKFSFTEATISWVNRAAAAVPRAARRHRAPAGATPSTRLDVKPCPDLACLHVLLFALLAKKAGFHVRRRTRCSDADC